MPQQFTVIVTSLTDAQVDAFKLAMMELGQVGPAWTDESYSMTQADRYGCIMGALVRTSAESTTREMWQKAAHAMEIRAVRFLSMSILCERKQATSGLGNMPRERSLGPYREAADP